MLEMAVTLLWTRKSFLILVNSSKFSTFLRMLKETSSNLWVDCNQKNYFSQHQVGIFRLKYTYFPLTTLTLILWGCSGSLVCGSDCHRDLVLVASSSSQGFLSFWWGSVLRIVSGQAERQRIEKNPIKSFWRKKKPSQNMIYFYRSKEYKNKLSFAYCTHISTSKINKT